MAQKTVLITGCSKGGIGDALAQEFQRKGLRVFASARNLSKIEHLKALGLDIVPLDVVDDASIKAAVETVKKATGGTLDFLVNNSGSGYMLPLLDTESSLGKQMFDVNVHGLIAVTQAFSPLLIASKGTIINIGSIAALFPAPWQGLYNATKAAVHILSAQLRIELKPFGVKVINVVTGGIKTHFFDNLPVMKLPEGSLYAAGKERVEWSMNGGMVGENATPVDDYARDVVKNALKRSPKVEHWVGSSTTLIWFVSTFFWHTFWDFILPIAFKFPNFTPETETKK